MDIIAIAFFYVVLSIVAGAIASSKNRDGFLYFLLSLLLSPLIGLLLALGMSDRRK